MAMNHLPLRYRWSLVIGWLASAPWRRPAPTEDRCIMGSVVHPAVWCRRPADEGYMTCDHHGRKAW